MTTPLDETTYSLNDHRGSFDNSKEPCPELACAIPCEPRVLRMWLCASMSVPRWWDQVAHLTTEHGPRSWAFLPNSAPPQDFHPHLEEMAHIVKSAGLRTKGSAGAARE
ncbi:hypothetical protein Hesp01_75580 [Herbidospora sp. NBRC 101105]|nr:hypothetical protein Hesp01_75580 [Herbidospora sp. NBRC 101105]